MATVRTEVAGGAGHAWASGRGTRLLLAALIAVTLLGAIVGMQVGRSSAGRDRAAAPAEPVYLHGRNLRGLDPIDPLYLHGRNLRGLDPIDPLYLHGRNLRGLDPIDPLYLHGRNLRGLDPIDPVYLHGRNLRGLDPLPED